MTSAPPSGRGYASLIRHLAEQPDEKAAMSRIAELAAHSLGCRGALILRETTPGSPSVAAATEPKFILLAGSIAVRHGTSISEQVLTKRSVMVVRDLRTELTGYGAELAAASPVRSILGQLLHVDGRPLGAMTLYSDTVGYFDARLQEEGAVFADLAAVALARVADRERAANLDGALQNSRHIGTAVGIIMATDGVGESDAFATLRQISRSSQHKVHAVARQINQNGYHPASTEHTA